MSWAVTRAPAGSGYFSVLARLSRVTSCQHPRLVEFRRSRVNCRALSRAIPTIGRPGAPAWPLHSSPNMRLTTRSLSPLRLVRLVPVLSALLVAGAGCDPVGPDKPPPFGLASIQSVQLDVHHHGGNIDLLFLAELTSAGETECPTLASDLAITVNGTPLQLSLYDSYHSFTISCPIHELDGYATLPETAGPLRVELSQGARKAAMVIASSAWPTIGPVSLSRTAVPVGESFSIDVAVSPADPSTQLGLAQPSDWVVSICPRETPDCVPGEGLAGLGLTNFAGREGGITFDVEIAQVIAPGERLLTVQSFRPTLGLAITECSGIPSCFGTNQTDDTAVFGPFDFEVLE
jgi:hypothetical protein